MSVKVLSLYYRHNKLGASCYDEETRAVFVLNDVSEDDDYRMLHSVLLQLEPSIVIISKAQDINFLTELNNICSAEQNVSAAIEETDEVNVKQNDHEAEDRELSENEDGEETEAEEKRIIALHVMPAVAYNFDDAKKRIGALFESSDSNNEDDNLRIAFRVNLGATNMICAFGALLKYLDAVRLGVEFEDINIKTPIVTINTLTLEQIVEIDENSKRALQIFQDELHPSTFKAYSAGGAREGLSLFRMCNRCQSKNGECLLRRWFERPVTNQETLKNRVVAIRFFVQDCNLDALDFIRSRLKKIGNLRGILKRAKSQRLSLNDWRNLYTTCSAILEITDYIKNREIKLALVNDDLNNVCEDIARITAVMYEIINFSESYAENRFVVNAKVDENLDRLKELYASLPEALTCVAKEEATVLNVPSSVCYVPMFGYLLVVPKDTVFPSAAQKIEILYETDDALHVKNERMRQLDQEIGDIKMEIIDIETNAMLRLKQLICQWDKKIRQAVYACATLDCIISLALTAREYDWHCPHYVEEAVIDVDGGRHAIAELLTTNKFIPNPIRSGGAQTKVKILLGPNSSGKSVYLKQVGIIVFLAHIGSFVPAKSAIIGPVNRIMTRIHTVDCVLDGMSTFAADLSQMALALRHGNGNSLILIDEFGKGTLMEAGLSLLTSSLNYWIRKGKDDCPHVFAISHFHSLINHIVKDANILSFLTMDVLLNNGKLNFQYKLVDGFIESSYASHIASKMGIDSQIVKRAEEINNYVKHNKPIETVDDDGELLFKIAPMLTDLKNINFATDSRDFLQKMTHLLLPKEQNISTLMNDDGSTNESDPDVESDSQNHDQNQMESMLDDSLAARHFELNYPKVLREVENSVSTSMNQGDEEGNVSSKTSDALLSSASKLPILKKAKFESSSRSSHSVSFESPLADLNRTKMSLFRSPMSPTEDDELV